MVTHELAHMWFYGLVGDDQELHPWLDEAFATFAEELVDAQLFGGTVTNPAPAGVPIHARLTHRYRRSPRTPPATTTVVYFKGAARAAGRPPAGRDSRLRRRAALLREDVRLEGRDHRRCGRSVALATGCDRGPAQGRRDPLMAPSRIVLVRRRG